MTTTSSSPSSSRFILKLSCPDQAGIVHAVTGFLLEQGGNILTSAQHGDADYQRFFMRIEFECAKPLPTDTLRAAFAPLGRRLQMDWELVARYMQVLSAEMCEYLAGRAINIHHSFLPSFKGAKPYHQAHERGVKLIGATAHYVSSDLDEGPIIEQEVARIDHSLSPDQLVAMGRDVECVTLARAIQWHAEHRVLMNGMRSVVFR